MPAWQQVETPVGLKTAVTIPQTNKVCYDNVNKHILYSIKKITIFV